MTGIAAESGVGREVRPDLVDKGRRLIQFLAAAQRLRLSPVRTLDTYAGQDGAVFWLGQAPEHPAVSSAARVEAPDPATPFLAVDRVASVPAPAPDPQVEPWLDGPATDPERSPALRASRTVDGPNGPQVVRLEESPDVQAAFDRWRGVWSAWAERELVERPVRQLYRDLFTAFNTLTGQPELYEVVLAVGCLAWKPEDHDAVRRHVLVAPATLECEVSLPDTVFDDESSGEPAGESVDVRDSVDGSEEGAPESQTHLDPVEGSPHSGGQPDPARGRHFADFGPEPVTAQPTVTPASLRLMTAYHKTVAPAPTVTVDLVDGANRSDVLRPYLAFSGWAPPVHEASPKEIELTMVDIIAHEGPILGARAHSAYVAASGGRRVGHVIAAELDAALSRLVRRGEVLADDPLNRRQRRLRTFRLPSQPTVVPRELGPRNLEEVPPLELAALLNRASRSTGWNEDHLSRESLRLLGRVRLTAPAQRALAEVIPLALTFEEAETAVDRL